MATWARTGGQPVSARRSLVLVAASFLVYLVPILAIACFGLCLSALTRNSAAVVGTLMFAPLMQLIGILPGLSGTQPYLLSTQLSAWQGFFRVPTDWLPIVRGLWVSAAYGLPALMIAYLTFLRRDVTGADRSAGMGQKLSGLPVDEGVEPHGYERRQHSDAQRNQPGAHLGRPFGPAIQSDHGDRNGRRRDHGDDQHRRDDLREVAGREVG